jgi:hypothetical protein
MSDKAETAASRLWRDRVQLREHERDEARARARIAEEKVAILTAENDRLAYEIIRLRALLTAPDAAPARAETEKQMEDQREPMSRSEALRTVVTRFLRSKGYLRK